MDQSLTIRPTQDDDREAIWSILEPTIRAGETYTLPRDMAKSDALAYWLGADRETFVALADDQVLGISYLRANQAGGGAHVANCGFMTAAAATGRGVARQMCAHALDHAGLRGFRAVQYNFVVSSNERAVRLWSAFGFQVVGRLPLAFHHPTLGYVDALVMFKVL